MQASTVRGSCSFTIKIPAEFSAAHSVDGSFIEDSPRSVFTEWDDSWNPVEREHFLLTIGWLW
jgi:hypothetical protein